MQGEGATGQAVPEQHGGEDDGDQRLQDQHSAEGQVRRVLYCSALYCTVLYCTGAACTTWRWPPTPAPPLR